MKKVDYIYQTVKNPHFVKNPGESAGFFKKTQKNPPGPGFFKILAGFANPGFSTKKLCKINTNAPKRLKYGLK